MPRTATRPVWPEFVLLAAIWGSSFLFMRWGASELGALPTAALRVGIGALSLLPWIVWQRQQALLRQHWRPLLLAGALNSGLPFVLYAFAVLHISTGLSSVLNATTPLFGALVAWGWLGERPGRWRGLGLLIGFGGIVLLALSQTPPSALTFAQSSGPTPLWAMAACLGATTCYALSATHARKHLVAVPALVTATGSQIGAAVLLLGPALWAAPAHAPSLRAWLALLVLGTLCSGLAYVLYFRLIERAGPARALTVTYLIPVFATAYGAVLLGESPSLLSLLCAAIVLLGTALSSGMIRPRSRTNAQTNVRTHET